MVKRCCWGTCTSDSMYPERLNGAVFVPFPKPTRALGKCMLWIGRFVDGRMSRSSVTKNTFICTKVSSLLCIRQFVSFITCLETVGGFKRPHDGRSCGRPHSFQSTTCTFPRLASASEKEQKPRHSNALGTYCRWCRCPSSNVSPWW